MTSEYVWELKRYISDILSNSPIAPSKRDKPKTGRNDPCPCGSNKKYKKCCIGK